jgi:beta-lactamase superfamily II metal-dependent hydrolase
MFAFTVFDVGHGFCAYAQGTNGTITLFDCGHDDESGFRPSQFFSGNGFGTIHRFILSNYDNDHVSDLSNLFAKVPIQTFIRNRSIDATSLKRLKLQCGPLSSGLQTMLTMHETYIHPVPPSDYAGVEVTTFYNSHPAFDDTNNLSVVSFLKYEKLRVVIPGDIERKGWMELLKQASFRDELSEVSVFVASHHGRVSGYCEEVFHYCHPQIVLISDKDKIFDSQEHVYTKHASGILWNGSATDRRYVLTTRCDGHMTITTPPNVEFHIQVGK